MIEGFFIPDSRFVENENFLAFSASKYHLIVKHKDVPDNAALNVVNINLLQCIDVDEMTFYFSEKVDLVENNLFGVWN